MNNWTKLVAGYSTKFAWIFLAESFTDLLKGNKAFIFSWPIEQNICNHYTNLLLFHDQLEKNQNYVMALIGRHLYQQKF